MISLGFFLVQNPKQSLSLGVHLLSEVPLLLKGKAEMKEMLDAATCWSLGWLKTVKKEENWKKCFKASAFSSFFFFPHSCSICFFFQFRGTVIVEVFIQRQMVLCFYSLVEKGYYWWKINYLSMWKRWACPCRLIVSNKVTISYVRWLNVQLLNFKG